MRFEMPKHNSEHHYDQHSKAAEYYDYAARHHREAAKYHKSGEYDEASRHAHVAHGHSLHAQHYARESDKAFASEYRKQ